MNETPLTLLSRRRSSIVLLEQSDAVTTLKRYGLHTYVDVDHYKDVQQYAATIPPDTPAEFLRKFDEVALQEFTEQYYCDQLATLVTNVGCLGLELVLRFTSNGARLSTLEGMGDGMHGRERFLAVSPSLYFTVLDARTSLKSLQPTDNKN